MRSIGKIYEEKACEYLEKKKFKIIERNFSIRSGEIDIVAMDGKWVVFVEVKRRKNTEYGYPFEFVNKAKQRRIIKAALFYIKKNNIKQENIRFDIVSITDKNGREEFEHIENAFDCEGYYF